MDVEAPEAKGFLLELYNMTNGDTGAQVSMFDVGAAVGLEKDEARAMAEELIVQGWVDIVTLSGGIGITPQGLEELQLQGVHVTAAATSAPLGNDPVIGQTQRQAVEQILAAIRTSFSQQDTASFNDVEEVVIDLKTIETQLLSPAPKTAVIREILRSLGLTLTRTGHQDLSAQLEAMIAA